MLAFLAPMLTLGSKIFTGIDISGVFSGIGNALKALGANIIANWKAWLIGLLVFAQVAGGFAIIHEHSRYTTEVTAHKADNAKFVAVQAAANLAEQNEKKQLQTESKAASHEADTNYSALLTKYNASLVRYAANKSGSGTGGYYQLPATESLDGSGSNAVIPDQITITGSDAEICSVNTARLQSAHDWALQQLQQVKDQPK